MKTIQTKIQVTTPAFPKQATILKAKWVNNKAKHKSVKWVE